MALGTGTDWITGSYSSDVQYLLEVAENNFLRLNPTYTDIMPQLDSVNSVFIGYGYDLLANSNTAIQDLESAGATIYDATALQNLLNTPLCHSSCRLDTSVTLGALRNDSGSIRQRIQRTSGGSAATA